MNVLHHAVALDAPLDRNRSQNTDSDGFLLGAYLSKWEHLEIILRIANPKYNSPENISLVRRDSAETFAKIRALQKKFGVDDEMLGSAAGFKDTTKIKEMIKKYEAGEEQVAESVQPSGAPMAGETKAGTLILKQPVSIQLPSGNVTLERGTQIQFLARDP